MSGEIILLADQDPIYQRVVYDQLNNAGYSVLTAENAEDALRQAKQFSKSIDLLLTGIVGPTKNGLHLSHEIRRLREGIMVLYMAEYFIDILADPDLNAMPVHFLRKPFTFFELNQQIEAAMQKQHSQGMQGAYQHRYV